ncbi:zinc finger protein 585B-like [Branchiostoma floridae]|uniref:Zinc finger protein 585B-like n=1 Tax=Branchiostoma floridae TaxID=7739 RepID=A0A9J7KKX0_BRAFL|nr:zinc finger protein 585B-like [Branchiostoma floridae]
MDERNNTSSIDKLDTGRQQNKEGDIPCEETCGVKSDNPAQVKAKQTDRLVVKRTVDKRFVCTECDYRTASKANLLRHTRKHTGEKPYKCDQCDYSAALEDKRHLKKHLDKHTS